MIFSDKKAVINKIRWERIFLDLEIFVEMEGDLTFSFVTLYRDYAQEENYDSDKIETLIVKKVPVKGEDRGHGKYTFNINITAVDGRSFLDNDTWKLCVDNGKEFSIVTVDNKTAYDLDRLTRVFRYGRDRYAYNMSFSVTNFRRDELELNFHSYFMIQNKTWKKRRYIQEAETKIGKVNRTYMYAVIRLIRMFYYIVSRLTPKKGNKVLFMTETKDYLWGNLKYIHDRIVERGLDKRFKISCSCRKSVGNNKNMFSWIRVVYMIARQDYIFIDDYAPIFGFFKLDKRTKLIQVWHAGEGFKSVGYSRFGKSASPFPSESCHKAYDHVVTGSEKLIHVYEEVFGLPEDRFLPLGMARLDGFLDEEKIRGVRDKIYSTHPELENKKVILFAPTFRGTGQKYAYYDYDRIDYGQIYEFCGDEWIFLIKMHPFVKEKPSIPEKYSDRIMDFGDYPDINELYYVTDILITDYSSNYYEYALMKRPVLFFTYDRELYELTRGVHRDVKSHAPGKVCDTFDELMTALKNEDYEIEKIYKFVEDNYGSYDGKASDRIIDEILLKRDAG